MAPSSDHSRPPKRSRVKIEDEDGSTQFDLSKCQQHPNLYVSSGNVVLLCEGTLFKLYNGYLVNHATEFKDMLSAEPVHAESYDKCPLFRLQDSAQDMEYFLSALLYSE